MLNWLKNLKELVNQNWVGVFVTTISFIAAIFFYLRSRTNARLAFQQASYSAIGKLSAVSPEVEIYFRGEKVPDVKKSLIAIWNCGNTTIRRDQVVNSDPLRIVVPEGSKILDVTLLKV